MFISRVPDMIWVVYITFWWWLLIYLFCMYFYVLQFQCKWGKILSNLYKCEMENVFYVKIWLSLSISLSLSLPMRTFFITKIKTIYFIINLIKNLDWSSDMVQTCSSSCWLFRSKLILFLIPFSNFLTSNTADCIDNMQEYLKEIPLHSCRDWSSKYLCERIYRCRVAINNKLWHQDLEPDFSW